MNDLIYVVADYRGKPRVRSAENGNLEPLDIICGWTYSYTDAVDVVESGEWQKNREEE